MEQTEFKITEHLRKDPSHVISITQGNKRLAKHTSPKYFFTLQNIRELYGGVGNLLSVLPEKGFTNGTTVELKKMFNHTADGYLFEKMEIDFTKEEAPMPEMLPHTAPIAPPTSGLASPYGLGYAPVPIPEWVTAKVTEQRHEEVKRENERLILENIDLKRQIIGLEQEKGQLKAKLDTAEMRADLQLKTAEMQADINLQKEILNKKGFFETPVAQKLTEALGTVLPMIAQNMMGSQPATALGVAPSNLSPLKQQFIQIISQPDITDEQVGACIEYLVNITQTQPTPTIETQSTDETENVQN